MALTIDSAAVLRALAEHPDAFPAVKAEIHEIARKLLLKQLKAKSIDLDLLQKICKATGADSLYTTLDSFTGNELVAFVKKVDLHSPLAKAGSDPSESRIHIMSLATGGVSPSAVQVKAQKPKSKSVKPPPPRQEEPKIGILLESKVHSGKPKTTRAKKSV